MNHPTIPDKLPPMTIVLTPDQQAWIDEQAERGRYPSVQAAITQLLDERIMELDIEDDDLAWAKPLADEGLADIAAGRAMTLEAHRARNRARLA